MGNYQVFSIRAGAFDEVLKYPVRFTDELTDLEWGSPGYLDRLRKSSHFFSGDKPIAIAHELHCRTLRGLYVRFRGQTH
ncbi:hypothetical protein HOC01_00080 [archaeon]|jgi:hypothetical protein|nr:hypothetical protein [archaeon]MBT6698762.1 hypothetical protein [archaeon]